MTLGLSPGREAATILREFRRTHKNFYVMIQRHNVLDLHISNCFHMDRSDGADTSFRDMPVLEPLSHFGPMAYSCPTLAAFNGAFIRLI
jgi:hypothetical protein